MSAPTLLSNDIVQKNYNNNKFPMATRWKILVTMKMSVSFIFKKQFASRGNFCCFLQYPGFIWAINDRWNRHAIFHVIRDDVVWCFLLKWLKKCWYASHVMWEIGDETRRGWMRWFIIPCVSYIAFESGTYADWKNGRTMVLDCQIYWYEVVLPEVRFSKSPVCVGNFKHTKVASHARKCWYTFVTVILNGYLY